MKKRIISVFLALGCILPLVLPTFADETSAPDETLARDETTVAEETTSPPKIADTSEPEVILEPPTLTNVGAAVVYNIDNDQIGRAHV